MSDTLRIATYNVDGLRGRLPRVLESLEREQPDVACLQELKGEDSLFPAPSSKTQATARFG